MAKIAIAGLSDHRAYAAEPNKIELAMKCIFLSK
jgi:hypothetical protein